jgi:hypothetical protein
MAQEVTKAFATVTVCCHQLILAFSFLVKFRMSMIIINSSNSYFMTNLK